MTIKVCYRVMEDGTDREVLFGVDVSLRGVPRVGDKVATHGVERPVEEVVWFEDEGPTVYLRSFDPGSSYEDWCYDLLQDGWHVVASLGRHGGATDGPAIANWVTAVLAAEVRQAAGGGPTSSVGAGRPADSSSGRS